MIKIEESALYKTKFKNSIFVLKISGHLVTNANALGAILEDMDTLLEMGVHILVIYGGGKPMDDAAKHCGHVPEKINGRRITKALDLKIAKQVMAGDLSFQILSAIQKKGIRGLCLSALPPAWANIVLRPKNPIDFGFVGDIVSVNGVTVQSFLKLDTVVFCPSLAVTNDGTIVNINADTVATEIAIAIKADKLIYFTDVDGVLRKGRLVKTITPEMIDEFISGGVAKKGMAVKLENAKRAINEGVARIHLLNGNTVHVLKDEIFGTSGHGTMVVSDCEFDNYQQEITIS